MSKAQELLEKLELRESFSDNVMKRINDFVKNNKSDIQDWCKDNDYSHYTPEDELKQIKPTIEDLERRGFSEADAYLMIVTTENFDPRISEASALARMKKLSDKYKK